MKILITGGSGFLGRYCCEQLLEAGHKVVVYDLVQPRFAGAVYCSGSILDKKKLAGAIETSDGVINLAGLLGTVERIEQAVDGTMVNVVGALNVFDICRRLDMACCHITVGHHFMNNTYAISKDATERYALMYNKELGTKISIVRGLNAYGPYQKLKPIRKIIPTFVMAALRNEPIGIYGDGEQIMDFIYIADLARILCRVLLMKPGCYDNVIEAGSGRRTTVNYVTGRIVELVGSASQIKHLPMRPGEPPNAVVLADTDMLNTIGFDPDKFMSLDAGLRATIEYYREILEMS